MKADSRNAGSPVRFSNESDVTLVVTSCGRFDLLKDTLESFDRYNTAPIREVFITEDSGDDAVHDAVPEHWKPHCKVFVNRPKLANWRLSTWPTATSRRPTSSIARTIGTSIAKASSRTRTPFWLPAPTCCRWLRSHAHDLAVHSPYIHLGDRQVIAGVPCYPCCRTRPNGRRFR